ncbi:hypothetical protein IG631_19007 [Alternaria alternata]|nr:hypothetical protein IG631_19007 [Alternaria alternata]
MLLVAVLNDSQSPQRPEYGNPNTTSKRSITVSHHKQPLECARCGLAPGTSPCTFQSNSIQAPAETSIASWYPSELPVRQHKLGATQPIPSQQIVLGEGAFGSATVAGGARLSLSDRSVQCWPNWNYWGSFAFRDLVSLNGFCVSMRKPIRTLEVT